MTADEATRSGSPADDLPAGLEAAISKSGRTYYIDHNTKTTSWMHPRGAQFCKPLTSGLPYPFERKFDESGYAYYVDHDTRTTSWLNPVKLNELKAAGILNDDKADDLVIDGKAGDAWPWIVKETIESGPKKGEEYWVNYRRGPEGVVNNHSPEDTKAGYLAAAHIRDVRLKKAQVGHGAKL
ncbi:hypothetical protein OIDMADRAFT_145644 [Oidiodendron maius Zn]|uniref:WW domain-containing protein n=1 Tax=Oidiodendron maius (strain Zn) TaxID=913774 RepID=A0A0C3DDW0_OIDMZ|nr:hypothetical protein OIDMADRAFT_145644 [Oidiodendron maius Zn]